MHDPLIALSLQLVEKICVTIVVAYLITRTKYFWHVVDRQAGYWDRLALILVFGGFSVYGTYSGVHLFGAIANTRDLAPLVAGLVGGPIVGIGAGIIGSIHRYSLGGFSAIPCSLATLLAGVIGGLAYTLHRHKFVGVFWAMSLAIFIEAFHMLLAILIARPLATAIELVRAVSLPMIIANAVGVGVFALIIANLIRERRTTSERDRYYAELERKIYEMEKLYRLGLQVSSTLDINVVLDLCISTTVDVIEGTVGMLLLVEEETGELVLGPVAQLQPAPAGKAPDENGERVRIVKHGGVRLQQGQYIPGRTVQTKQPIRLDDIPPQETLDNQLYQDLGTVPASTLSVPLLYKDRAIGVIQVWNRRDGNPFSAEDEHVLVSFAVHAAIAIENARLYQEVAEQERVKKELEIAHKLQTSLLPEKAPEVRGFQIAAHSVPAKEVGGDFFDFVELDSDTTGIMIGDVAGKGLPAALFMALSRSFLRAQAIGTQEPGVVLERTNRLIASDARDGMFVTGLYAVLSTSRRTLTVSNAGHNPLIVYHPPQRTYEELRMPGMALGAFEDVSYTERELTLSPGDIVLLYTDGVTETVDESGHEQFGVERIIELLQTTSRLSSQALVDSIIARVKDFGGTQPQFDDITVVVIKTL